MVGEKAHLPDAPETHSETVTKNYYSENGVMLLLILLALVNITFVLAGINSNLHEIATCCKVTP